jgi:carboxyl-terminal processing protease
VARWLTLDDPYTVFIEPAAREVERERLQGTFGGIGAYITRSEETGEVFWSRSPATRPRRRVSWSGDVSFSQLMGVPITAEMTVPEIIDMVKGEKGTAVTLTLRHPGAVEVVDISVVRDDILLPSVVYRLTEGRPDHWLHWPVPFQRRERQ